MNRAEFSESVVARNRNRLAGYKSQVGTNRFGGAAFTEKQRKRILRKAHRAQRIWETLPE